MNKKWIAACGISLIGAAVVILVCTFFGAADITIRDTLIILANKAGGFFSEEAAAFGAKATIIWKLRFPRTLLDFLTGGTLAV